MIDLLQQLGDLEDLRVAMREKAIRHQELAARFQTESESLAKEIAELLKQVSKEAAEIPGASIADVCDLSRSERAVLTLLKVGLTHKEIGEKLGISERTSKWHASNIYRKLGIERGEMTSGNARLLMFKRASGFD